jgi:hypothetical protein
MNRWMNRGLFLAAVLACSFEAAAHNLTSLVYDEKTDTLVVEIAYRGTHENHAFSLQWGECRRLDDDRSQIDALLIDNDPMDPARQEFTQVLKVSMSGHPCRPSKLTIRTAAGFNRTVDVPKAKPTGAKSTPPAASP